PPTAEITVSTVSPRAGADFTATLNDQPVDPNRGYQVHEGDRLAIGHAARGRIGYLAVTGGLQVAPVLGSRSTTLRLQLGGYSG
ncbi:allophanate hydrolase subunit 2 family protein, partial [Limosilactobacillus fermentum]